MRSSSSRSARRTSSSPASPFLIILLRVSFAWRLMFLMATRPSSALCRAVLMYSRLRSSVSSGSTILMMTPSFAGFTPRSLFLMARSIAASEFLSNGWMTIIRGSGTWNEASWFTGVCVP